jgi:hypothetical protein
MEENYQILKNGQDNHYVVVHKEHPGFLANVSFVNDTVSILKITLMEVCELSILIDALNEIERYFREERFKAILEAKSE